MDPVGFDLIVRDRRNVVRWMTQVPASQKTHGVSECILARFYTAFCCYTEGTFLFD